MNTRTVTGFYGSGNTPADVFVYDNRDGSAWYVVDGGTMVNKTYDVIENGVNVEELSDDDCFTWSEPITSEEELENAVND